MNLLARPLLLTLGALLLMSAGPAAGSAPLVRSEANPVLDPRTITSPSTGTNSVVAIFDLCVAWDDYADTWRVYWTFFDALAEERGSEMDTPEEEAQIHDAETNLGLSVVGWFHATSADGQTWTLSDSRRAFSADTSREWEDLGLATGADAAIRDGVVHLFYPSLTTTGGSVGWGIPNWPLNLATRPASADDEP